MVGLAALILALAAAAFVMWPRQRKLDGVQKYSDVAPDESDGGDSTSDPVTTWIGTEGGGR
ncbi:MAG: hypothetical protein WAU68_02140 [Vitreimonas sp.]